MKTYEIMEKYTAGELTLEGARRELEKAGSSVTLLPGKNELTDEEIRKSVVGHYPDMANGWGLLDSGTGTLDKVQVTDGKLAHGMGPGVYALCIIGGRTYYVDDTRLTDTQPGADKPDLRPERLDMGKHPELAGETVVQDTKMGRYAVTYNRFGHAVKALRL